MYATSARLSRVLIATSTPPASATPKWASSIAGTFGARKETKNVPFAPGVLPAAGINNCGAEVSG